LGYIGLLDAYGTVHHMVRTSTIQDNSWHCVEFRIKLNTPATADGIVQAWVDGVQVYSKTDVKWSNANLNNITYFSRTGIGIGNVSNEPWDMTEWTAIAFDDVVVSTEYIGPIRSPYPAAPSGLKIIQ
jgi:hypothetical protein